MWFLGIRKPFVSVSIGCFLLAVCAVACAPSDRSSPAPVIVDQPPPSPSFLLKGVDWLSEDSLLLIMSSRAHGRLVEVGLSGDDQKMLVEIAPVTSSVMVRVHPNVSEALAVPFFQSHSPVLYSWMPAGSPQASCPFQSPSSVDWAVWNDSDYLVAVDRADASDTGGLYLLSRVNSWEVVWEVSPWIANSGVPSGDLVFSGVGDTGEALITWFNHGAGLAKTEEKNGLAKYPVSASVIGPPEVLTLPEPPFSYRGLAAALPFVYFLALDRNGSGSVVSYDINTLNYTVHSSIDSIDLLGRVDIRISPEAGKLLVVSATADRTTYQVVGLALPDP